MKKLLLFCGVSLLALIIAAIVVALKIVYQGEPSIQDILNKRVGDKEFGVVVGLVDKLERKVIIHGVSTQGSRQEVDGNTLFELCSVTKVLTSTLLAEMAERGEVALDDPIDRYLPEAVSCPKKNGKRITLLHLATHTSGLPSRPYASDNDSENAIDTPGYVTFSEEEMYQFLSGYELTREPGSAFEYSNLGMGLLGHILGLRAGAPYEQLVVDRLLSPLGMDSTRMTLTPELQIRLAPGHYRNGEPARHWMLGPSLVGAGALRSTANDMLSFLAANLGLDETPLACAMEAAHQERADSTWPGVGVGLGWCVYDHAGEKLWIHSGGVPGYRSFIGFSKSQRKGVVVLTNSSTDVEDIGLYVLDKEFGLLDTGRQILTKPVEIDLSTFDHYAGLYRINQKHLVAVSREDNRLFLQITRQPRFELLPEAPSRFFVAQPEAQFQFLQENSDEVTDLVIFQAGHEFRCPRIPPAQIATVDTDVFDSYVGLYKVNPSRLIVITREDDRLFVQPTMQPREELHPRSATEFFVQISDTKVSFIVDQNQRISGLKLQQGNDQMVGTKVEEQRNTVEVDAAVLEALTGLYQHSPDFHLTVIKIWDRLFIQGTSQPMHELHPISDTSFFLSTAPPPAMVSFSLDKTGKVVSLTVHTGNETEMSRKIR